MENIKKFQYEGINFVGANILFKENLGIKHSNDIDGKNVERSKLYHLITNRGVLCIDGLTICDYESNLVEILDNFEDKIIL